MDALQKGKPRYEHIIKHHKYLTHLRYHQIYTYTCTIATYLRDCFTYMKQVATHTMDYVDTTTTKTLSLDILPV